MEEKISDCWFCKKEPESGVPFNMVWCTEDNPPIPRLICGAGCRDKFNLIVGKKVVGWPDEWTHG